MKTPENRTYSLPRHPHRVFLQLPVDPRQLLVAEPGSDQGVLRFLGFFLRPELFKEQFLFTPVEDRKQVQDDRKRGDENAKFNDGLDQHIGVHMG